MPNDREKVYFRHDDGERWDAEIVKVHDQETVDLAVHVPAAGGGFQIHGGVAGAKLATTDADKKIVGRWWPKQGG